MLFFSEMGNEGNRVVQGGDDGGRYGLCRALVRLVYGVGFLELRGGGAEGEEGEEVVDNVVLYVCRVISMWVL